MLLCLQFKKAGKGGVFEISRGAAAQLMESIDLSGRSCYATKATINRPPADVRGRS